MVAFEIFRHEPEADTTALCHRILAGASVSPAPIATAGPSPSEPGARFVGRDYAVAFVAVALAGFAQAITQPDVIATPAARCAPPLSAAG